MVIGVEAFDEKLYKMFVAELSAYADCLVTKVGDEIRVQIEGTVVQCMCVVAICDKYRFGEDSFLAGGNLDENYS